MRTKLSFFLVMAMALTVVMQGCSDEDGPYQNTVDFDLSHFHESSYSKGNSVTVHSERGPQKHQSHRSSDNFSTEGLTADGETPKYMMVSCPDNISFKINIDKKNATDEEWAKDVYNGAILPYRKESKFYIADPSNAKSSFDVKLTAFNGSPDHVFTSSPGRCQKGQDHRAGDNFQLPKTHTRYRVHISDASVKFEIMEDVSAASDHTIAKDVSDGDIVNMSYERRNYYLANVDAKGPFQVLFEPITVEWMSMLPDDMNLANVSIPGTHDTGTYDIEPVNFGFSKCQNMPVAQQLDFGIRYLDLRVDVAILDKAVMKITHGGIPCDVKFEDVVKITNEFLRDHPKEVVIYELSAEADTVPYLIREYLNDSKTPSEIKNRFYLKNTVPTLREARGKIVVLRRYSLPDTFSNESWGLDFSGKGVWPNDGVKKGTTGDGIKYYIEDRFFTASSTHDHDTKEKRDLINAAIDDIGTDNETLYLLFASVSASAWHTPYDFMWGGGTGTVSPEMSEALRDKLNEVTGDSPRKVGWIIMDYYNRDGHNDDCHVVERIINTNFSKDKRPFDVSRIHSHD